MMFSTLDILLMNDEKNIGAKTEDWEKQIDLAQSPKKKFPLKVKEDLSKTDLNFSDPQINPKVKNHKRKEEVKTVTIGKKKSKNNKNLF